MPAEHRFRKTPAQRFEHLRTTPHIHKQIYDAVMRLGIQEAEDGLVFVRKPDLDRIDQTETESTAYLIPHTNTEKIERAKKAWP